MIRWVGRSLILLGLAVPGAASAGGTAAGHEPPVATFSIVACDTSAGEWGVAVASKFLAVGAVVPWARAGVGAIATQAFANTSFGPAGLTLLQDGRSAEEALSRLLEADDDRALRQVGIVDASGRAATATGGRALGWAGGVRGPGFAIQGNSLAGEEVVLEMARSFAASSGRPLAERLLAALEAGEGAGGDSRGRQAAALLVVRAGGGYGGFDDRYIDLRVDDADEPIAALARLYRLHARTLLPLVHARLGDEAHRLGHAADADREYRRTIDLYRDAIAASPDDPEPRNGLAWFFVQRRLNLDEALALAREALALAPESWQVLDSLAEISFVRGRVEEARAYARRAAEANPSSLYLRQQLARFRGGRDADEGGEIR